MALGVGGRGDSWTPGVEVRRPSLGFTEGGQSLAGLLPPGTGESPRSLAGPVRGLAPSPWLRGGAAAPPAPESPALEAAPGVCHEEMTARFGNAGGRPGSN